MNIDFYSEEDLQLRYADEEELRARGQSLVNHYMPVQDSNINFHELFDVDESNNQSQPPSESKFFDKKNLKPQKQSKHQLTIYLKESLGNLKTRRKTVHRNAPVQLMKGIENVVIPSNNQELIKLFLSSEYFTWFIRIIALVNLVGIFLIDYSFRLEGGDSHGDASSHGHKIQLSKDNVVSLSLQLFANCVFTFQILLRLYQNSQNIKNPYLIMNVVGTVVCWATIFFDIIENDSSSLFRFFMIIRIVRAIARILEVFSFIRTPFEIFVNTIPSLRKLFFPLIVLMLFYAIIGMALFSGANKYRCAETTEEGTKYTTYCGASLYECPEHQKCVFVENEADRGLDTMQNMFNLVRFDNIGNALLTVYHFIYNTNFNNVRAKFTYYINPYISSLYFISSSVIFCYIFSNLIMVSMSKAYIEEVESKAAKEEKVQIEHEESAPPSFLAKVVDWINAVIIVLQTITLCYLYKGMSSSELMMQALIDFILLWFSCLIILLKVIMERSAFKRSEFNFIDSMTIGVHLAGLIITAAMGEDIIYSAAKFFIVMRSVKVIRIIRLLYLSPSIFTYEKYIIKVFLQTLNKIKFFIVLILCFVLMFKELGELLFGYEIRAPASHLNHESVPYIKNFEGSLPSFFSILFLFFNETWTETMYTYYQSVGLDAIIFYYIVVFIAFLMLMRLYIAVFLCYFKAELHKQAKKKLICGKTAKPDLKDSSLSSEKKAQGERGEREEKGAEKERGEVGERERERGEEEQVGVQSQHCIISMIQVLYRSSYFDYYINGSIFVQSMVIMFKQANDTSSELQFLDTIQNICFGCYLVEVLVGCISQGVGRFLRKSRSNVISFGIIFVIVAAFIPYGNFIINNYLRRITIIKIFTIFRNANKEMTIIIDSIFVICKNFFNFLFIYTFFVLIVTIVPFIFFYDADPFHVCTLQGSKSDSSTFLSQEECLHDGGVWDVPRQNFNNIFESVALMYQIISTESWTAYLQSLWYKNHNLAWQFYFTITFFVYNICFLNIFLGFIVETYLQLKDKAYNLNKLKRSQVGWILIKNRINALFPKSVLVVDPNSSPKRKLIFGIVMHEYYETFFDYLAYANAFLYLITYEEQHGIYNQVLIFFKKLFCAIFVMDSLLKAYGLRSDMFLKNNSIMQFLGSVYICIYWAIYLFAIPNNEEKHILEFFLVVLLLVRCKSLLLKYSWCKTNMNSVIDILPKCGNIIKLVCVVLFFYASIGLQIFKYVKTDNLVDNYTMGFNNIITAMITLARVSVAESWQTILSALIKTSTQDDVCYHIRTEADATLYTTMGCGTLVAYPYFISFHIIMVLLVLNLLIATMASAYDDNYEIQYNSINIFQLEDCLSLWQKYDPKGTGVVQYKKFWRLTSQIAILFGISKKKLIKRKNKFFQQLDLQIYQHKDDPVFCYRFHDVITKFSKIKLEIANTGNDGDDHAADISFDIHPDVLKEIKDYIIPFPDQYYNQYRPFRGFKSAETKYIFGLLKKMRQWKHGSTEKKRGMGVTKLSNIFDIKSKRFDQEHPSQHSIDQVV